MTVRLNVHGRGASMPLHGNSFTSTFESYVTAAILTAMLTKASQRRQNGNKVPYHLFCILCYKHYIQKQRHDHCEVRARSHTQNSGLDHTVR